VSAFTTDSVCWPVYRRTCKHDAGLSFRKRAFSHGAFVEWSSCFVCAVRSINKLKPKNIQNGYGRERKR
jgi:hypothetical protein